MPPSVRPTGVERTCERGEIIVTKTDLHGRITCANDVFLRRSALTEGGVLGEPRNVIRHPDMPAASSVSCGRRSRRPARDVRLHAEPRDRRRALVGLRPRHADRRRHRPGRRLPLEPPLAEPFRRARGAGPLSPGAARRQARPAPQRGHHDQRGTLRDGPVRSAPSRWPRCPSCSRTSSRARSSRSR
jgi:hypothetical protein